MRKPTARTFFIGELRLNFCKDITLHRKMQLVRTLQGTNLCFWFCFFRAYSAFLLHEQQAFQKIASISKRCSRAWLELAHVCGSCRQVHPEETTMLSPLNTDTLTIGTN